MGFRTGLHLDYAPLAECEAARWAGILGVATFNRAPPAPRAAEIPVAEISTPVLAGAADVCEIWRAGQAVESGHRYRVRYRRTDNVLFGCIAVPESSLTPIIADRERTALHGATEQAYREIFAVLDAVGYPHLLRVWNYLPEINRDTHGTERYRQFNSARQGALLASGRPVTGNVPAACVLGAAGGSPLVVYFLASRTAPTFIENPRQVSAYHYPPEYGARTPAFSRATVLHESSGLTLFVSGTASIVGHRTIHIGDAAAQTRETLTNIEALLAEANRATGASRFRLDSLAYKVYVRHAADLPVIQEELCSALGSSARIVYLKADICREDLLVEIEATGMYPLKADA
jgi:chorismate lyase / 3-hydroxybenzoate synthase